MGARSRLDRFLFAPVAPAPAAWFRALLAAVVARVFWPEGRALLVVVQRVPEARELFEGVFLTPLWWMIALAALLAFALGIGGRRMGFAAAALLLPLLFVRHAVSRQVLWCALLAWSCLRTAPVRAPHPRPPAGPLWPVRLVQIQLSLVYGVNAVAKLSPEYLRGDVLIALSRALPNFRVDLSGGFLELGFVALPAWLCAAGTFAVEAALAVGFWIPKLRLATAALGLAFHASLRFVLEIGWLDWTCVFLYLAFLLPFEHGRTPQMGDSSPPAGVGDTGR